MPGCKTQAGPVLGELSSSHFISKEMLGDGWEIWRNDCHQALLSLGS